MEFREYKNRAGKVIKAARLNTKADMLQAYTEYLTADAGYQLAGNALIKSDKTVALGDYLVLADKQLPFTEVDGMFKKAYYPADFNKDQEAKWLSCPTLLLMTTDTAEEALAEMERRGL